jgi:hypothetical protein
MDCLGNGDRKVRSNEFHKILACDRATQTCREITQQVRAGLL